MSCLLVLAYYEKILSTSEMFDEQTYNKHWFSSLWFVKLLVIEHLLYAGFTKVSKTGCCYKKKLDGQYMIFCNWWPIYALSLYKVSWGHKELARIQPASFNKTFCLN